MTMVSRNTVKAAGEMYKVQHALDHVAIPLIPTIGVGPAYAEAARQNSHLFEPTIKIKRGQKQGDLFLSVE